MKTERWTVEETMQYVMGTSSGRLESDLKRLSCGLKRLKSLDTEIQRVYKQVQACAGSSSWREKSHPLLEKVSVIKSRAQNTIDETMVIASRIVCELESQSFQDMNIASMGRCEQKYERQRKEIERTFTSIADTVIDIGYSEIRGLCGEMRRIAQAGSDLQDICQLAFCVDETIDKLPEEDRDHLRRLVADACSPAVVRHKNIIEEVATHEEGVRRTGLVESIRAELTAGECDPMQLIELYQRLNRELQVFNPIIRIDEFLSTVAYSGEYRDGIMQPVQEQRKVLQAMGEEIADCIAAYVETNYEQMQIAGEGNCLFCSLATIIKGSPSQHYTLRQHIVDYMKSNIEDFESEIGRTIANEYEGNDDPGMRRVKDVDDYLRFMRQRGKYGDRPEVLAAAERYGHPILTVHKHNGKLGINEVFIPKSGSRGVPVFLHHTGYLHYNVFVPLKKEEY